MTEYIPQFSPHSFVTIDEETELINARNVLFSTIVEAAVKAEIHSGPLTQERIYSVAKEEFQAYRTPVWNKDTGVTTYTSKGDDSFFKIDDSGYILECKDLNIGSIFTRMNNWVSKERLRLPYCRDTGELLEACIKLLHTGKVPFPGMTIFRNEEEEFTIHIPPFKEEDAPSIKIVSITLRRWLEGIANRHVFLMYSLDNKGLTFVYTLS